MWRPNEVVRKHRTRAALLWVALIIGVCAYASVLLANAQRRRRNPSMSFGFRLERRNQCLLAFRECLYERSCVYSCHLCDATDLEDTVYKYPDMSVCLNAQFGCEDFFLQEACAKSSNATEGGAPNATFIYDWFNQEGVPYTVEPSILGTGYCVTFKTSEVLNPVGSIRSAGGALDYFTLDISWYPSGFAGTSNTCVSEEGSWEPHRELVFFYLIDPETGSRSIAAPMPYSCVTASTASYASNYVGIGLTNVNKLGGEMEVQYKTTSTTSGTFKTKAKPDLQNPYAHLSMVIHQQANSLELVTEVDPLDMAEIFGNIGGFWDLIMIFWPIFFVAVSTQNPTLKPRNFKKSVAKGAEIAAGVSASTSARFSTSFVTRGSMKGGFQRGTSRRSSSSSSGGDSSIAVSRRGGGRVKVGSSLSRRGSFASTQAASFNSNRDDSLKNESNASRNNNSRDGGDSNGSGDGTLGRGVSVRTDSNACFSSSGAERQGEKKNDAPMDQSSGSVEASADHIVKLADTKG